MRSSDAKLTNNKPLYRVYVEGGLHDEFKSYASARKRAEKIESEGWNVRITKVFQTILGPMETERF